MGSSVFAAALSVSDIMSKNQNVTKLKDMTSEATLTTADQKKTFHWWRKLNSDGQHFNTLIRFDSPVEVRGEGVLFLEHAGDDNEVLIYLPAYKKIRRVETQQQSGSFMASEFSYSDLSNSNLADYHYKLIKNESCPDSKVAVSCYVVDAVPASDTVKLRTGYSHKTLWVRSDNFVIVKAEFFNTAGEIAKKMTASDLKTVKKSPNDDKWMALTLSFTNAKTSQVSTIRFSDVAIDTGLNDSIFTQQNLSRVK
jgi:uncharacterized protein